MRKSKDNAGFAIAKNVIALPYDTSRKLSLNNTQSGFTIVEILVVVIVMGIIVTIIVGTLGSFYLSNSTTVGQTIQIVDTRSTLRIIESDVSRSNGFLTNLAAVNPTGMNNDTTSWNYQGADPTKRVLIATTYGTDKAATDDTRQLQYVESGGICDTANGTPFKNNLVYFVQQDSTSSTYNLYRRTMIGSGTSCPGTLFQKQTCTANGVIAQPTTCKANDALLVYDISSFAVDYYTSSNDSSPISDQYGSGSANVPAAKAVGITITANRKINGVTTPYTSKLRISRIN